MPREKASLISLCFSFNCLIKSLLRSKYPAGNCSGRTHLFTPFIMFIFIFLYVCCLVNSLPQNINDISSPTALDLTSAPITDDPISLAVPACRRAFPTSSTKTSKLAFDDRLPPPGYLDCPPGKHHHCCRKGNFKMCAKWDETDEWCSDESWIYCCREVRGTLGFECEQSHQLFPLPEAPDWIDDLFNFFEPPAQNSCPSDNLSPES